MISFAPKIANIQPAIVKTGEKIIIQGFNFKKEQQYGLRVLNGYNNDILGMLYTAADKTTELSFTNSLENDLTVDNYYRCQIVETKDREIVGPWSNIAVVKCILKPATLVSFIPSDSRFSLNFTNEPKDRLKKAHLMLIEDDEEVVWDGGEAFVDQDSKTIYWDFNRLIIAETSEDTNINLKVQVTYITESGFEDTETKNADELTNLLVQNDEIKNDQLLLSDDEYILEKEHGGALLKTDSVVYRQEKCGENWVICVIMFDEEKQDNTVYSFFDTSIMYQTDTTYIISKNGVLTRITKNICFDHSYLSDAIENYCIKFNPQISSLRQVIKEEKVETIGSQYPFIFQNGVVNYKEFSLNGLISHLWDYVAVSNLQRESATPPASDYEAFQDFKVTTDTDLTDHNIKTEYLYREKLLQWLNNGKPKIFKSPTEGALIVQITGVSLTPNETLGRMLYTFGCTVTEIAEYTLDNLKKYQLIQEG